MAIATTYHKPKGFKHTTTAADAGSGLVSITCYSGSPQKDRSAVYTFNVFDSSGVVKNDEAKAVYSSGVLTIEDNGGFSVTENDIVNCQVMLLGS